MKLSEVKTVTCIIGYLDHISNVGYIAGDSARCNFETGYQDIVFHSKVFISVSHPDILIGATTSFRHIDLLKYYDIFEGLKSSENLDHMFMVKNVVPRVHDLFGNYWTGESNNNGANVIIVTPYALFEIQPDYSVTSPSTNYTAVGIGMPYAIASLHTSDIHPRIHSGTAKVKEKLKDEVMDSIKAISHIKITDKKYDKFSDFSTDRQENRSKWIEDNITVAMQCAERCVVGVHAPFLMLSTDGHHKVLE